MAAPARAARPSTEAASRGQRVPAGTGPLALVALLAVATLSSGCPDDTFEYVAPVWCGDRPCLWTVDEGEVGRGPTWHEQDPALVLISSRVRVSLRIDPDGTAFRCTGVSFLGDFGWDARVFFELDVGDDATVDHSLPLAAHDFEREAVAVNPDLLPRPVPTRLILRKEGDSRASFADLRLICGYYCPGEATTPPAPSSCN